MLLVAVRGRDDRDPAGELLERLPEVRRGPTGVTPVISSTPVKKVCGGRKSQKPRSSPTCSCDEPEGVRVGPGGGAVDPDRATPLEFLDRCLEWGVLRSPWRSSLCRVLVAVPGSPAMGVAGRGEDGDGCAGHEADDDDTKVMMTIRRE